MLPKNGCSGMSMPGAKCAVIVVRSSGMIRMREYGNSSVWKPAP